jgi:hypothetical protein
MKNFLKLFCISIFLIAISPNSALAENQDEGNFVTKIETQSQLVIDFVSATDEIFFVSNDSKSSGTTDDYPAQSERFSINSLGKESDVLKVDPPVFIFSKPAFKNLQNAKINSHRIRILSW